MTPQHKLSIGKRAQKAVLSIPSITKQLGPKNVSKINFVDEQINEEEMLHQLRLSTFHLTFNSMDRQ